MISNNLKWALGTICGVAICVAAGVWTLSEKFDGLRQEIKQDMIMQKTDGDRLHQRVNEINDQIQQEIGGIKDRIGKTEGQLSRISAEAGLTVQPEEAIEIIPNVSEVPAIKNIE